jgi:hypothetical protein
MFNVIFEAIEVLVAFSALANSALIRFGTETITIFG